MITLNIGSSVLLFLWYDVMTSRNAGGATSAADAAAARLTIQRKVIFFVRLSDGIVNLVHIEKDL